MQQGGLQESERDSVSSVSEPGRTWNEMPRYSTVSTLKPMVGIVVMTSPSFNLYKTVVLPAASRPSICSEVRTGMPCQP